MAAVMQVPMTPHSYEDVQLQLHAHRIGVPEADAVVGMAEVRTLFANVDAKVVQKHMDVFAALDTDSSGTIDYEEFVRGFVVYPPICLTLPHLPPPHILTCSRKMPLNTGCHTHLQNHFVET